MLQTFNLDRGDLFFLIACELQFLKALPPSASLSVCHRIPNNDLEARRREGCGKGDSGRCHGVGSWVGAQCFSLGRNVPAVSPIEEMELSKYRGNICADAGGKATGQRGEILLLQ